MGPGTEWAGISATPVRATNASVSSRRTRTRHTTGRTASRSHARQDIAPRRRTHASTAYSTTTRLKRTSTGAKTSASAATSSKTPGACNRSHMTYHPALKRCLLTTIGEGKDTRLAGGFGVYDAPEPWGHGPRFITRRTGTSAAASPAAFRQSGSVRTAPPRGSSSPGMTVSRCGRSHAICIQTKEAGSFHER
jgi:hypothetical protein